GFYISGVENALFFAILCGLLEIIPFIGNLTGTAITLLMVLAQGGSTGTLVGVVITYVVVQFVQSYLVEPLVVGKGVSINPLFTILGLVAGEFIWGIPGMVLALPAVGIMKVVFDHIEPLKPVGKLMGDTKEGRTKRKKT
ncbi:MAG TPA: AI-2E family transporter, partial [Chitinophagaceae bacterium]|nr:AI-2E family transporter [Chitinophagaceae bacterium]